MSPEASVEAAAGRPGGSARRARRRTSALLSAAFLAQVAVSLPELGVPTLVPAIKADLGLSTAAVGALVAAINVGRLGGAYPSGRLVDRVGERPVMVFGTIGAGLAFALAALAPSAATMAPALLLAGTFTASATPAGISLVLSAVGRGAKAVAVGIRQSGVPAGGALAALALPALSRQIGWRGALLLAAALAIVCSLIVRAVLARHPSPPTRTQARGHRRGGARGLLANRRLMLVTLWSLTFAGGQYVMVTYLILTLTSEGSASLAGAAAVLAAAQLLGIAGRVLWGLLSDRLLGGTRWPVLLAISLSGVAGCSILALCPAPLPAPLLAVVAIGTGLSLLGYQGIGLTAMVESSPAGSHGAGLGFGLTFISASIIVLPPAFGAVTDLTGGFRASWLALTIMLAASTALPLAMRRAGGAADAGGDPAPGPGQPVG
jgi:MFS family permease